MFSVRLRALAAIVLVVALRLGHTEENRARDIDALQEKVQLAIERAEPSVVCILVSHSDDYKQFAAAPTDAANGKLGRFNAAAMPAAGPGDRRRAQILSLDLSHPDHVPESFGSGVVIDESGLVLTAAHVVRNATKLYVRLPGGKGSWADIHALDSRSDLAVLRLLDRVAELKAIPFGDGGIVKKGQFVVGLANPFAAGFRDGSPSASWGIVSNLRRRAPGSPNEADRNRQTLHQFGTLLQTDVRLNLGCSGGALLNLEGELIGLTTATAAISGGENPAGFAVPLDTNLRRIINVLRRGEEVEYGFLGVQLQQDARPAEHGVVLQDVAPGSPAQRAGLQRGDRLISVNGAPIRDNEDLFLQIGINLAGATVQVEASRLPGGLRRPYAVKLAKFLVGGPVIASKKPPAHYGMRVDYSSILSQRPGGLAWVRGIPDGVVIREVLPRGAADRAHLQPDKIITHVNQQRVGNPAEYYDAVEKADGSLDLTLLNADGKEDRVTLAAK